MHALALGLLLAAACLHVGWNVLIKGATERDAVTWLAVVLGAAVFLPVVLAGPPLPGPVWALAVASAGVEAVYYLLLARAYEQADFSQAYPVARGSAPVLLTIWSALLLGEHPSPWGALGIGLVVAGLLAVAGVGGRAGLAARRGLLAALGVALCISIYSVIDGVAARRGPPAPYTVAVLGLTGVFLTPLALARQGPRVLAAAGRRHWRRAAVAGALMVLGYMLVLRAYAIERLAYAGAVREVSVVLAALVGWRWLGEPFGARRVAGSGLVFLGILVLALFG